MGVFVIDILHSGFVVPLLWAGNEARKCPSSVDGHSWWATSSVLEIRPSWSDLSPFLNPFQLATLSTSTTHKKTPQNL